MLIQSLSLRVFVLLLLSSSSPPSIRLFSRLRSEERFSLRIPEQRSRVSGILELRSSVVLAAAKRSGRARGRSTGRGRTQSNLEEISANGSASAPMISLEATALTSDGNAPRRLELLRRLNQITQQRYRLEREVSRGSVKTENGSNGHNVEISRFDSSSHVEGVQGHEKLKRPRAVKSDREFYNEKQKFASGRELEEGVGRGKQLVLSKGRRSNVVVPDAKGSNMTPGEGSRRRPVDPRHTDTERGRVSAKDDASIHIDLDAIRDSGDPGQLDLMLVESSVRKGASNKIPLANSTGATRGSARVRTPSVLLSSHPGEKVPSVPKSAASKNKQVAFCLRIVKEMLRLKDAFGFSKPIDQLWSVDQLPGYFELIKNPMDLDSVRRRLESGYYLSTPGKEEVEEVTFDVDSFSRDMRLIFTNARTYNREGDIFYEAATRLLEKFEGKMKTMPTTEQLAAQAAKKNKKRKKAVGPNPPEGSKRVDSTKRRKGSAIAIDVDGKGSSRHSVAKKKGSALSRSKPRSGGGSSVRKKKDPKVNIVDQRDTDNMSVADLEARLRALKRQRTLTQARSPASSPAAGGGSYMAQAQALYHVAMTYEEKVQLSENVSKLPPDKLNKIVALATRNKTKSMEVNKNEEIELDIDSMNNKTLRDMEAYVNQILYRKKKGVPGNVANADIYQMSNAQLVAEIEKLSFVLRRRTKGKSRELADVESREKGQKSFYDSDSSSESGDSEGSDSSGYESSSEESSGDESDADQMRRRREQNLAHQQAMRAAGTPLPSPSYNGGS